MYVHSGINLSMNQMLRTFRSNTVLNSIPGTVKIMWSSGNTNKD